MLHTLFALLAAPLCQSPQGPAAVAEPIPVLIVSGANNHDWEWTSPSLKRILEEDRRFRAEITVEPAKVLADRAYLDRFAVVVLDYNGPRWGEAAERVFLEAVRDGLGVTVIHAANNAFPGWKEYEEMVALCWRDGTGHGRFHPFDVKVLHRAHPITRGLADMTAHPDELYHRLVPMHGAGYELLGTAYSAPGTGGTGQDEPMILTRYVGRGRIFHTPLGHVWKGAEAARASHRDPQFRNLVRRGTEWAATGDVRETAASRAVAAADHGGGWQVLFDGSDVSQWRSYRGKGFPDRGWVVEDGSLRTQAGAGGGDLVTVDEYGDFEFELEFKVAPGANSGIIYRVGEDEDASWRTGPEFQIFDDAGNGIDAEADTSVGALYAVAAPAGKVTRPAGEWNHARIVLEGGRVEHWLNGVRVLQQQIGSDDWKARVKASKFASMPRFGTLERGRIALQEHGNDVWFRNVRLRALPAAGRVVQLFDGISLAGWTGVHGAGTAPADVWSVQDGILVCKGSPTGYLRTEGRYENFVLRLQWRWNPETRATGNGGVLLRVQEPDQIWPVSIEAQLQAGSAGDIWRIGEYPLQVAADRTEGRRTRRFAGAERPVGEWNDYEIVVDRGTVRLFVNGDLVNEGLQAAQKGGFIALQSEGAEMHFRGIELQPLD
ncbi:MAG TPA: family 16 glycoside hydrolase [Planctomycetota bacterium]